MFSAAINGCWLLGFVESQFPVSLITVDGGHTRLLYPALFVPP